MVYELSINWKFHLPKSTGLMLSLRKEINEEQNNLQLQGGDEEDGLY